MRCVCRNDPYALLIKQETPHSASPAVNLPPPQRAGCWGATPLTTSLPHASWPA